MKLYFYIMLLLVLSCKTKDVNTNKTQSIELETFAKKLDSIFEHNTKAHLEAYKKQSLINANLSLNSFVQYDSFGKRIPFHYKHYVDGELKEEIFLEGGDINKSTASVNSEVNSNVKASTNEKGTVKVDASQNKTTKTKTADKKTKVKVTGFQFGFYAWLFLIVIALVVLRWVSKKFKLPDKLKSFLKGG